MLYLHDRHRDMVDELNITESQQKGKLTCSEFKECKISTVPERLSNDFYCIRILV